MGLVSDGGVHSYPTHIKALHDLAVQNGITPYMHAFMMVEIHQQMLELVI